MIASWAEIATILGMGSTLSDSGRALINLLHPMCEQAVKDFLQFDPERQVRTQLLPARRRSGEPGPLIDAEITVSNNRVTIGQRGRSSDVLQLKYLPVVLDGLEVREDPDAYAGQRAGSFGDSTLLTAGSDFWLDVEDNGISRTGHLYRIGAWPSEPRSVKITYAGGWSRSDFDSGEALTIKKAVLLTAVKAYKQALTQSGKRGGGGAIISESLGKYAVSYESVSAVLLTGMVVSLPTEAIQDLQIFRNYGRLVV